MVRKDGLAAEVPLAQMTDQLEAGMRLAFRIEIVSKTATFVPDHEPDVPLVDAELDKNPADPLPPPADCCDLWTQAIDKCPSCDTEDCLVLATVPNYVVGNQIVDTMPSPVPMSCSR